MLNKSADDPLFPNQIRGQQEVEAVLALYVRDAASWHFVVIQSPHASMRPLHKCPQVNVTMLVTGEPADVFGPVQRN